MPHTEARIMNMEARMLAELNTPGELCIRGYCVMLGYWGEPQKTEEAVDQDKWYRTGDIATMNEQGFCKIVGRSKDMIIRGGENIYPAELEDFFHTHPKVQEVQVVGVKDDRMGEEICACIRLKDWGGDHSGGDQSFLQREDLSLQDSEVHRIRHKLPPHRFRKDPEIQTSRADGTTSKSVNKEGGRVCPGPPPVHPPYSPCLSL
ncbi:hypothetical protein H8959_019228 [Pygathrix nigripes]